MTRPFPCFTHPFLWISAVLFFSQCSRSDNVDNPPVPPDPDKPFLTITQALPAAPFGAQGGSAVLIFSTNEPWRITTVPLFGSRSPLTHYLGDRSRIGRRCRRLVRHRSPFGRCGRGDQCYGDGGPE